ncbi:transcription initiation factor [Theileria orientalis]|uniref:Transcription initiation factor n=1 Tax=Theileria orientalis TaxID=68886 RepID=A0A976SIG0_THEOR|nr:transcription initiation factor [Theileria orientalis]
MAGRSKRISSLRNLRYSELVDCSNADSDSDTTKLASTDYASSVNKESPKAMSSSTSNNFDDKDILSLELDDKNDNLISKMSKYSCFLKSNYQSNMCIPMVQNIVASVHLGQELDLREIAISTRNAEYNPKKFNALVLRMQNPKCTGLIFRTGRIIITGSKTIEDTKLGAKRMAKMIRKELGADLKFNNFKIENIIATFNCNVPIRLEVFSQEHKELSNYEPEFFAGLVYRCRISESSEAVLLIFVSGNVIITGCKSAHEIQYVFKTMYPILQQYQK